ncbi:MAG TPA: calcium-binding protein [Solirubrobacteraceae bacterium]|nr:calcium-binding protein [Solirubrobacteraceae bacterium]
MRFLAAVVLSLALAGPAGAATVGVSETCDARGRCTASATFRADPGEANRLTITKEGHWFVFHDAAAEVRTDERCVRVDGHTVRCAVEYAVGDTGDGDDVLHGSIGAHLGPGDDRAEITGGYAQGGEGDDVLLGGPGGQSFEGGPGDDRIAGGAGSDTIGGGAGRDELRGGAGADSINASEFALPVVADLVVGGPGRDTVSWQRNIRPVVVDLADAAPDGSTGARETLRGIESAGGTAWPDWIAGDAGPNSLSGGSWGPDVVLGRGGDDLLDARGDGPTVQRGGRGDDRIFSSGSGRVHGGPGDDHLTTEYINKGPAEAFCGRGVDRLTSGADEGFRLLGCEHVEWQTESEEGRIDARPVVSARGASFRLRCYYECTGVLILRDAAGRLVGRRALAAHAWATRYVTVPVPPHVAAALRGPGGWSGQVAVRLRVDGRPTTVAFAGRLHAR